MTHDDQRSPRTEPRPDDATIRVQAARGAKPGGRILVLLIVSVAAVAVLLLGIWALNQGNASEADVNPTEQATDTDAFNTNAGAIPQADAPTTATGQPTNPQTGDAPNVNVPTQ